MIGIVLNFEVIIISLVGEKYLNHFTTSASVSFSERLKIFKKN
jgi:hypothetical protein